VDHLDAGQDNLDARLRLEAEHRPYTALDSPVILFDPIVQIPALADADRLQRPSRSTLHGPFATSLSIGKRRFVQTKISTKRSVADAIGFRT
jgi:hypothetical protein